VSNAPAPTPAASPTSPGAILAGKYRVERILGQGGMGVVVEARHIALDDRVALKFLLPEYAQHPEASARFLREARNAVKIKSEHVARVSDVGTLDSGAPYMVMEYLEGRDLADTLEKAGVLAVPDAVDYIIQGSEAIAEAHSYSIVHRDLKPANLFLSKRPDGSPIVKVLDFGISKGGGQVDNLTKTTAAMGSALYMSPEQLQQTRSVDHRTDIYALGISLYELLAGKQPFYADTLPQLVGAVLTGTPTPLLELRPDIPPPLAAVIERAYARDRGQRFQSIGEFVVALAPWAPPRSATTIERVARMSGLPTPELTLGSSGVFAPPSSLSPTSPAAPSPAPQAAPTPQAPLAQPGGGFPPPGSTQMVPSLAEGVAAQAAPNPALLGTRPTVPLPAMDPTAGTHPPGPPPGPPPGNPNQIVPGHYNAPMSVRAANTFKQGGSGPLITGQPRSKAGLIAVLVMAMVGIAGIAAAVVLRTHKPTTPPAVDTQAPTATAPPAPAPTAEPTATATAAVSATAAASATAEAVPTATPKTAEAPTAAAPQRPMQGGRRAPTRGPTAPPTPTAQPDKKNDGNKTPDLGKMY
jgi:eukaryotic-like serine/threonine-protein kinase